MRWPPPPLVPTSMARRALLALLPVSTVVFAPSSAHADVVEEVRKTASVLPGYGPPDLLFPAEFKGRWRLTRTILNISTPLGADKVPPTDLQIAQRQALNAQQFDMRFVETSDESTYGDRVIPDRAFNAEQREAALTGVPIDDLEARWSASNPNVVTMRQRSTGTVTETKVTKRSTEAPAPFTFGTSEYARVADAGSSGVLGGVPRILATRERVRYRWDGGAADAAAAAALPARIEGLSIYNLFDPTQTGFADLSGATPVLTVKARLSLERVR